MGISKIISRERAKALLELILENHMALSNIQGRINGLNGEYSEEEKRYLCEVFEPYLLDMVRKQRFLTYDEKFIQDALDVTCPEDSESS